MELAAAAALTMLAVTVAAFVVLHAVFGVERRMKSRLRSVSDYTGDEGSAAEASAMERVRRTGGSLLSAADEALRRIWTLEYRTRVRQQLSRAGRIGEEDVERFLRSKVVYAGVGLAAMLAVGLAAGWAAGFLVLMCAGAAAGGLSLPDSRLKDAIRARQRGILRELPDVIDMLTISVTAGLGFEAAAAKLVKNSEGLVVSELERMLREVNAGASRAQAMRAMAERVDTAEMTAFVSAVTQAESFGTPMSAVLRTQSADLRLRRRQRAEEEAQKAPVKMTIPLMLVIMPATILLLLGPALASLATVFG